MVVQEGFLRLF